MLEYLGLSPSHCGLTASLLHVISVQRGGREHKAEAFRPSPSLSIISLHNLLLVKAVTGPVQIQEK